MTSVCHVRIVESHRLKIGVIGESPPELGERAGSNKMEIIVAERRETPETGRDSSLLDPLGIFMPRVSR